MSTAFTKALIRACKLRVSGHVVNFKTVVAQIGLLDEVYVTDSDLAHHFAEGLLDLASTPEPGRRLLRDTLVAGLLMPDVRQHAIGHLAHTRVDDLRKLGLWDDEAVS